MISCRQTLQEHPFTAGFNWTSWLVFEVSAQDKEVSGVSSNGMEAAWAGIHGITCLALPAHEKRVV